jgi:ABC-type lipoprotein export system ATPase subunit
MSDAPDLAELERRAAGSTPEYGEDAHIVCDNLVRIYQTQGVEVIALQGLDLLVAEGEMVALVGASGSGKSTLLNILAGLDVPTAGVARVAGADLLDMSGRERLRFRRELVGFVWQQTARNLLPYLSAAENVELPMRFAGRGRRERRERAEYLLDLMGVADRAAARPTEMSGGEQQRAAIAVAVANQPKIVLADEPTGELDTTTVIVTHDPNVAGNVDRTVGIRDGRTSSEILRRTTRDAEGREEVVAAEYAVLDRAGRLQLPREFTAALDMRDRVRLALETDHIGVWPDRSHDDHR